MLLISNLSVNIQDRTVIKNCSGSFVDGQVHVIMGPNGSGKSSLAAAIMGHPDYQVTQGVIELRGQNLLALSVHQRAAHGIFLGLQHPIEVQGLQVIHFLKELCAFQEGASVTITQMLERVEPLLTLVGLSHSILQRCVNVGFSGGEKKRFELLQMLLLRPQLAILDELDSGVDVDGLKHLSNGLNWYREHNPQATIILITHYRHILEHLQPDMVHVMIDGTLVVTGDKALLDATLQNGYEQYAKRS